VFVAVGVVMLIGFVLVLFFKEVPLRTQSGIAAQQSARDDAARDDAARDDAARDDAARDDAALAAAMPTFTPQDSEPDRVLPARR